MNSKFSILPAFTLLLGFYSTSIFADFDKILEQCADCHGKSGNSDKETMPTIAGISQVYFIDTMEAFKEGNRPASIVKRDGKAAMDMQSIAKKLNEEQTKQLAKYFSEQKFILKAQDFDMDKAIAGKKLHKKYCEKCHEKGGSSSADDAGILAGQQKLYLKKSLDEIIKGERDVGKKMMKRIEKIQEKYGDDGFDQLIQYYISQGSQK
ncbi:MAG: c-type cytochrome [Gammaproteobacteria bacterium]|nr:c-type cytochrome [Gammaproteobacteria bacterium]